jgi:inorganic phosphate transporter, PiT family
VSFAHGTNDGQKSIGLIMLAIIGLFPAYFALNPMAAEAFPQPPQVARDAAPLIERYGDDEKARALTAAQRLQAGDVPSPQPASFTGFPGLDGVTGGAFGLSSSPAKQRAGARDDIYQLISQLEHAKEAPGIAAADKAKAADLGKKLGQFVEYAPWWVRILSALCLGIGTMIGYRRIVVTLGERLGNTHLTPAQGAAAEVVASVLIGVSGFTGLPVSTTHIVTSGIGGTMLSLGAGLRIPMLSRILIAWLVTLPVTIVIAAGLYYVLASPTVW